jgi:hypothetical protein
MRRKLLNVAWTTLGTAWSLLTMLQSRTLLGNISPQFSEGLTWFTLSLFILSFAMFRSLKPGDLP